MITVNIDYIDINRAKVNVCGENYVFNYFQMVKYASGHFDSGTLLLLLQLNITGELKKLFSLFIRNSEQNTLSILVKTAQLCQTNSLLTLNL